MVEKGLHDMAHRATADDKIERCPLLAWWEIFTGASEKIRQLDDEDQVRFERKQMVHVVVEAKRRIERIARQILPVSLALGPVYLQKRLHEHG